MEFLNDEFELTKDMVDFASIVDEGDSCSIPLRLSKIPKCYMRDPTCSDLISEIYISVLCNFSKFFLMSRDVFGKSCAEKWKQKEDEIEIVQEIIQGLE